MSKTIKYVECNRRDIPECARVIAEAEAQAEVRDVFSFGDIVLSAQNITDEQIRKLRDERAEDGDILMSAICAVALGHELNDAAVGSALDGSDAGKLRRYATRDAARAECARVISEAEDQS